MLINPEDVGLRKDQLSLIDPHLKKRYIDPGKISGALTLIARKGKIVHNSPLGMMDRERQKPMTQDTIFRIFSMTKPITAVAFMMLYEQGLFQLNDPVWKFIPEWKKLRVFEYGNYPGFFTKKPKRHMTILDLLTHTSGLTYGFLEKTNVDAAYRKLNIGIPLINEPLDNLIEKLSKLPLEFSPGQYWNYSVSTDVIGYLIEVISGLKFDKYLQTKLFDPLKMIDTGFNVPPEKIDRFAANYYRMPDKSLALIDDPVNSNFSRPTDCFSGGAGLVSTASDYLRFCTMFLNGGELDGVRILGKKTIDFMSMNHLPDGKLLDDMSKSNFSQVVMEGSGFGLGFAVNMDPVGAKIIGSPGECSWGGLASTTYWIDPAEELIVIFMTQLIPEGTFNFRGQLKTIIYGAISD